MAEKQKSDMPPIDGEERFHSLFMESPVSLWEEDITGLVAYLDTLRSSGIRDVRAYFNQHPDEIGRCVRMIRVLTVNKATLELYEAPDEKSLLDGLSEVFSEESFAAFREILVALAEGRKVFNAEAVTRTLRGKTLHVKLKGNLLPDEEGRLARALISVVDVTERKQAEKELRESEGRYRTLVETADDAIILTDLLGNHLFANSAYFASLGYAVGDDPNPDGFSNLHPDDGVMMKNSMGELIDTGKLVTEYRVRHKNGNWRYRSTKSTLIRDDAGNPKMILAVCRDITERTEMEILLQQQRAQLEEAQRISHVGSWERDISTNAVRWSDELLRIFGINPREEKPTFQMLLDMMHPDDREPFQKCVRDAVYEKKPYSIEYRISRSDGSTRIIHARGDAQYDGSGKPLLFRGTAQDITERKKTDEALRESEQKFRNLAEESPNMIFINKIGRIVFANKRCEETIGYSRDEFYTPEFDFMGLIAPEHRDLIKRNFQKHLGGEYIQPYEYALITKSGERIDSIITTRLIDFEGEQAILGIITDITERKKAERALLDSEMRYRTIFEQSGDYIMLMKIGKDGVMVITDMNETALRAHGYSREEMVGRPINFIDPAIDLGVHDERIEAVKNGSLGLFTTQHRRKDGSLFDVEVKAQSILIGGELVIVSTERDVTERKRMEETLRNDEEFIRNILNTVDEAFIVIDRDYRIVTANKAYCVSASCDDIIGKHCYEISHRRNIPCHDAGEECAVRTVFETGRPQVSVHTHQDEDGRLVYVETKAFPLKDSSGNVTSAIETINNITEKHLLEEERLKTQKLEAIGTLAGGIAHDFNNLLQGVFGYISLAKLTAGQKDKSVAALEQAEKALHMSVNLTSQLLTFSKGGKPVKQRIDLRPVIENAARFALSGSRSDYLLDISNDLLAADTDSGQIGQVIQNIVLNADQAMPEGGHVEIRAKNVQAPDNDLPQGLNNGRYVKISIKDNGVGIPEQYLAKIFDPYFTTKEKGSGLGLATSYSIVRNHGGLIDVRSLPGKGSTFIVYIPAAAPMTTTKPVVASVSRPARRGRILVMDDDEVVRDVAGELIRTLGHDVDFAERGEVAMIKYQTARETSHPYDIVILDLTIRGGMGGVETIQKLREIDPEVKAVVSSGYSDNAATAEYQKIGFSSFLKKPYHIEELRDTLNALLS